MSVRASFIVALGAAAALVACHKESASGEPGAGEAETVLCLNAASTKDALEELARSFATETGIHVKLSPEDSSKLANQIVNGAPADVFLSANDKWADFVGEHGLSAERRALLGNSLVIVVPAGNPAHVAAPADLAKPAVVHVAIAGPTVPAGIYAKAALTSLSLWSGLDAAKKLTPGENVRGALAYVERGEAEAGIVYATDAKVTNKVEVAATFDASTHPKIVYPLVLLRRGAAREPAKKWFSYLATKAAADVFARHGFIPLAAH